ncbi:hypothetical protein [Yinghuangia seranimata]|uniref:hypothetical protein n=1 Tax=Yinghuangia seranimata TaxID=408067 RepID=UPI00248B3325|nr:hypothetical protein [Yinghuangia seranimata]MDI2132555.1 hypothetical protein [Yinghuangia seranimata]
MLKMLDESFEAPDDEPENAQPPRSADDITDIEDDDLADDAATYGIDWMGAAVRVASAGTVIFANNLNGGVTSTGATTARPVRQVRAGTIRREELDFITRVFVESPGYQQALRMLRAHLLVVDGAAHSGRRTLALHLLIEQEVEKVTALASDSDLTSLRSAQLQREAGYLFEATALDSLACCTTADIQTLADILVKSGAYLVITTSDGRSALPGSWQPYLFESAAPSGDRVVREYLTDRLGPRWAQDHQDLVDARITQIAADCRPADAASLAADLVGVARGLYDKSRVLGTLGKHGRDAVRDWFAKNPRVDDWAMMLAAAVFEGHDYSVVNERAEALSGRLSSTSVAPPHNDGADTSPSWAPVSRSSRLDAINAECESLPSIVSNRSLSYRIDAVRFSTLHWGTSVLDHFWLEYPELREPLFDWLAATPARRDLHKVAGVTAGRLAGAGSGFNTLRPIRSWGRLDRHRQEMAAIALGIAAEDPVTATQVRHLLNSWSSAQASRELRWTAARAYGGPFGEAFPELALMRLLRLANTPDSDVMTEAAMSILRLSRSVIELVDVVKQLNEPSLVEGSASATVGPLTAHLLGAEQQARGPALTAEVIALLRDPGGRGETITLLRSLAAEPGGYNAVHQLVTGWLDATADPNRCDEAELIRDMLVELFAGNRRAGIERLAYDVMRLAFEGGNVNVDVLQPAIDAFEDPLPMPGGTR